MDDAARRLLHAALESTRDGRVVWELFPEDQMIRGKVNRTFVRITPDAPGYNLVFHEAFVRPPEEYVVVPDASDFPLVEQVYRAGRAVARDTEVVTEERLQRLNKG